jgi:Alpha/beta hydrolase family
VQEQNFSRGSAVLVHGRWGHPEDWYLVSGPLQSAGIQVVTADLPSHRSTDAGLAEDAAEVRAAIQACEPPVVAAGWSYGGEVLSVAAAGEQTVSRLIYVADIPQPVGFSDDGSWLEGDPHIIVGADRRFVPDNDWWLNEGDGTTFTPDIRRHFRTHPRRWVTRGTLGPQTDAAWLNMATTVLIGRHDPLLSEADKFRAAAQFDDLRVLDTDHFVIFRYPGVVVDLIMEALAG